MAVNSEVDPTLYIDGVPQPIEFQDVVRGVEVVTLSPPTRQVNIGVQIVPVQTIHIKTIIDEVVIFRAALTVDDVGTLMELGVGAATAVSASGKVATTWAWFKEFR